MQKTELITFGSKSGLKKQQLPEIRVENEVIKSSECIRFLGTTLNKDLEMKKFISTKVRAAYVNIKKINKIRKFLTEEETKMLMSSNVLSHLDYGNSILVNLPKSTIKSLQSIQNYAAKVVCKKQKYDSSTECLYILHWLPIHYRCIYKLVTIMYKTSNTGTTRSRQNGQMVQQHCHNLKNQWHCMPVSAPLKTEPGANNTNIQKASNK